MAKPEADPEEVHEDAPKERYPGRGAVANDLDWIDSVGVGSTIEEARADAKRKVAENRKKAEAEAKARNEAKAK